MITGTGRRSPPASTCAGSSTADDRYTEEFLTALSRMFRAVFDHPRPTVAAINGHAIAGGCVLALACDARLMSAGRIGLSELAVGVPFPVAALEIVRHALGPGHGSGRAPGRDRGPRRGVALGTSSTRSPRPTNSCRRPDPGPRARLAAAGGLRRDEGAAAPPAVAAMEAAGARRRRRPRRRTSEQARQSIKAALAALTARRPAGGQAGGRRRRLRMPLPSTAMADGETLGPRLAACSPLATGAAAGVRLLGHGRPGLVGGRTPSRPRSGPWAGNRTLLLATMALVVAIIALIIANYAPVAGAGFPEGGGAAAASGTAFGEGWAFVPMGRADRRLRPSRSRSASRPLASAAIATCPALEPWRVGDRDGGPASAVAAP